MAMIITLEVMLNGFRKAGCAQSTQSCWKSITVIFLCLCHSLQRIICHYCTIHYFSMACVIILKIGTVFAIQTPSGIACPHPGIVGYCFPKSCVAMQIITAIILLFVSLARQFANAEYKHCRKKSASFVPLTPDLVCHSAKTSYQSGSW